RQLGPVLLIDDRTELSRQALAVARRLGEVSSVAMDAFEPFAPDALAAAIAALNPGAVVAASTERGNDVVARVAARTGLPFAANCIAVEPGEPITVTRLRWGGTLLEEARLHSLRPLITVTPHSVPPDDGPPPPEIPLDRPDDREFTVQVAEHIAPGNSGVSLAEAKGIVSGGRGVGSEEGVAIIENLAGLLRGAGGVSWTGTSRRL